MPQLSAFIRLERMLDGISVRTQNQINERAEAEAEQNEVPLATQIAEQIVGECHAFYHMEFGELGYYDHGVRILNTKAVLQKVRIIHGKSTKHLCDEVKAYITDMYFKFHEIFDTNLKLLNFKNTMFDARQGIAVAHTPDYYSLVQFDWEYIPTAVIPPLFNDYLQSTFTSDVERIRAVQLIRKILTNDFIENKEFLFLIGKKDSGKGVYLRILTNLIGVKNTAVVPLRSLGRPFSCGDLLGKRLVYDADASNTPLDSNTSSQLKTMTGNDLQRHEKKGQHAVYSKPTFSYSVACNLLPDIGVGNELGSLTDRPYFLPFPIQHPIQDSTWEQRLMAEIPQIGSYILSLTPIAITKVPNGCTYTTEEYWKREGNPTYAWIVDNIVRNDSVCIWRLSKIIESVLSHIGSFGIVPDYNAARTLIKNQVYRVGGRMFYKQINTKRETFVRSCWVNNVLPEELDVLDEGETVSADTPVTLHLDETMTDDELIDNIRNN